MGINTLESPHDASLDIALAEFSALYGETENATFGEKDQESKSISNSTKANKQHSRKEDLTSSMLLDLETLYQLYGSCHDSAYFDVPADEDPPKAITPEVLGGLKTALTRKERKRAQAPARAVSSRLLRHARKDKLRRQNSAGELERREPTSRLTSALEDPQSGSFEDATTETSAEFRKTRKHDPAEKRRQAKSSPKRESPSKKREHYRRVNGESSDTVKNSKPNQSEYRERDTRKKIRVTPKERKSGSSRSPKAAKVPLERVDSGVCATPRSEEMRCAQNRSRSSRHVGGASDKQLSASAGSKEFIAPANEEMRSGKQPSSPKTSQDVSTPGSEEMRRSTHRSRSSRHVHRHLSASDHRPSSKASTRSRSSELQGVSDHGSLSRSRRQASSSPKKQAGSSSPSRSSSRRHRSPEKLVSGSSSKNSKSRSLSPRHATKKRPGETRDFTRCPSTKDSFERSPLSNDSGNVTTLRRSQSTRLERENALTHRHSSTKDRGRSHRERPSRVPSRRTQAESES